MLFVMGSVAGFDQKEKEVPPTEMATNIVASRELILLAALSAADLTEAVGGRNFSVTRSLPERFLREETPIGGWRAACFIGWLGWPVWLAAGYWTPEAMKRRKRESLSRTVSPCGIRPQLWKVHE
jgi:hypothetical protein